MTLFRIPALISLLSIANMGCSSGGSQSPMQQALSTGDSTLISSDQLMTSALADIDQHSQTFDGIKSMLLASAVAEQTLTAIDWNPSWDAALLQGQYPKNDVVLYSNYDNRDGSDHRKAPLAIAGSQTQSSGRYLVFGGSPFRNDKNDQMDQFLNNSLAWLANRDLQASDTFKLVLSNLDQSQYFKDRSGTRTWLDQKFNADAQYNEEGACDGEALQSCLSQGADVLIVSQHLANAESSQAFLDSVQWALNHNISVIYLQRDGGISEHGKKLLSLFDVTHNGDNYWPYLTLNQFDPMVIMNEAPEHVQLIKSLLTRFQTEEFNLDLSACTVRSCPDESGFNQEFLAAANTVKAMFNQLDREKINIFQTSDYQLEKQIILLADKFRQQVEYPMDKTTTSKLAFLKSLFADYAVYNTRSINPVQTDMGNFSRSDFSHIRAQNVDIDLVSKPYFRSTGVYALPGQTMTVTRTDNSSTSTEVFINTLRTGATHIFEENKYNRPYLLTSQKIPVLAGETIHFTSSYGGPVQIAFSEKDIEVSFSFKNIGRHPHWRKAEDNEVFASKMQQGDYDWAEIATAGFEVHSKLEKLRTSLADSIWPVASDFATATERYTHNLVHKLAGFNGPGIDVDPAIHDFVEARGLQVDTIDIVKHMNADQPTCGWGCSGNPYDAGWNFSPTGHGDIHELGHGIERSSMRLEGYGGHSNTNFYSYYAKSYYEDETGESASCQGLPFSELFTALQQSQNEADAFTYMADTRSKSWSEHHAIYIQLMMAVQKHAPVAATISEGWTIYPRLHIWDREFYRADNNEESWAAKKEGLGFSNYTLADLTELSQNDRLMISLSEISMLDLTLWFNMYGFAVNQKAIDQVKSKNYGAIPLTFFTSSASGYCSTLVQNELPVDGNQQWPEQ